MLELGNSKPWTEALESITGELKMNAGPLLSYFQPLKEWLQSNNTAEGRTAGWTTEGDPCKQDIILLSMTVFNFLYMSSSFWALLMTQV